VVLLVVSLLSACNGSSSKLDKCLENNEKLVDRLEASENKTAEKENQLKACEGEMENLKDLLATANTTISDQGSQLKACEGEMENLKDLLATANTTISDQGSQLKACEGEMENLKANYVPRLKDFDSYDELIEFLENQDLSGLKKDSQGEIWYQDVVEKTIENAIQVGIRAYPVTASVNYQSNVETWFFVAFVIDGKYIFMTVMYTGEYYEAFLVEGEDLAELNNFPGSEIEIRRLDIWNQWGR